MLSKIIKYDLKSLFRLYGPIYAGVAGLTIFTTILCRLNASMAEHDIHILSIASGLLTFITFFCLSNLAGLTMIVMAVLFYNTVVGNEGYLTNTLPVSKRDIVVGKNLSGMCIGTINVIVAAICGIFFYLFSNNEGFLNMFQIFKEIREMINSAQIAPNKPIIFMTVIMFLIALIVQGYLNVGYGQMCVSLGQMMNKNKILWTIIFMFGINTVISIIVSVIMVVIGTVLGEQFMTNIDNFFDKNSILAMLYMSIGCLVVNAIISVVINIVSTKILEKKLNLD